MQRRTEHNQITPVGLRGACFD